MESNKLTFIGCNKTYKESKIVILGAPFDGTTSFRPGTRFAPNAIRTDSEGLETYSPYFNIDIDNDKLISDIGDVEIPIGNTEDSLSNIKKITKKVVNDNKKQLLIGGEHLVTLPVIEVLQEKYKDLVVIQLDAHADLREEYLGLKYSHATVMRRCFDLVEKNSIYQFGIRSGSKEEFNFALNNTHMHKFDLSNITDIIDKIKSKPVYLTIDLDVLDPSIFPGTGTPEAGGVDFKELMAFLSSIKDLNLVGADVVELSPHYDQSGVSTAVASKVIREVLCLL